MQTYTGKIFDPGSPTPDVICIEDIAHALSLENRYGGHTRVAYSVAQHSVLVASQFADPRMRLHGLLHDSPEAYCKDIPRALKSDPRMAGYRMIEAAIEGAICTRFGLDGKLFHGKDVKRADLRALATEARDLMQPWAADWSLQEDPLPEKLTVWSAEEAEQRLLYEFGRLY